MSRCAPRRCSPERAGRVMELKDSVFLVTGGGSGLGAATGRRLAAGGARVVLVDVNVDGGQAVAAELGDAGVFVKADVGDEEQVRAAVAEAERRYGALHGAV